MRKVLFLLWIVVCSAAVFGQQTSEGSLYATGKNRTDLGSCPLKNTAVRADISGFVTRVSVRQEFENTFTEPIEAVYVFPLSQNGAVDSMTMTVGERVIRGKIMRRDEARKTYETARSAGQTAALLDQERTNIFTQAVANIMPGERVIVEISYLETLKYEDGAYEFVFPMTVGERYNPADVKDANKIAPPMTARNGSDISIEINLNAGVPVEEIRSTSHEIDQINFSPNTTKMTLKNEKTIPNKDFILRYDVTGKRIEDAILTHRDGRGGFFTLILQPPDKVATEDRTPKEIVFVLDTSGSMSGFPIEKAKEAIKLSLDGLYPEDTFNIITFAGDTEILFPAPVPATRANLEAAQNFLAGRSGGGGTEMMKAIKASLDPSDSQEHLRIVCFMTDGQVGNDDEIVAEVKRHPKARVFSFGIGSSVNRALLDKIAQQGKGEATYVGLQDDGSKAASKFYERVRTPLLTDLSIDWAGMPVADVYPGKLTDLFSAKPVILHGRYTKAMSGSIKLKGTLAGAPYERAINLVLPENEAANDSLATLWARTRVDELSTTRLMAADTKTGTDIDLAITNLGLEFGLMTKFTSFVAVEDRVSNPNGDPTKVAVPVTQPEGTVGLDKRKVWANSDVGYITTTEQKKALAYGVGGGGNNLPINARAVSQVVNVTGSGTGSGSGSGSGSGNGVGTISATVTVTADSSSMDSADTSISTTITRQVVELLPRGSTFSSLLKMSPNSRPQGLAGGFQIDGSSGSENLFILDGRNGGSEFTIFTDEYFAEFPAGGDQDGIRLEGIDLANARANTLQPRSDERSRSERLTKPNLQGRIIAAAEPVYPKQAADAKALGLVTVAVEIDLDGNVVSAKAASGSQHLRAAAEQAAVLSKFVPAYINGNRVRIKGTIVYDFESPESVKVYVRKMKAQPPTEADKQAGAMSQKMHIWIYSLAVRLENKTAEPTPNESKFVREGKADIRVDLTSVSAETIQKLKAAGFEPATQNSRTVLGRIAIENLVALAAIKEVTLISPRI